MRVAIVGISHESLTFSPVRQTLSDFVVLRGKDVLRLPGLTDAAASLGIEPVPVFVALSRCPSGVVEEQTYLQLRDEMIDGLRKAGRIDAVCLILHGAMLVENIWSGETDQVRAVRAELGYDIPIAARLDPHANLTEEFANKTDIWAAFRTAPHRDQAETLHRTLGLLASCVRLGRRPQPAFVRVPLLLPGERATTRVEPMRSLLTQVRETETQRGILNAEVLIGFGWADAPHAGASIVVVSVDKEHLPDACRHSRRLAKMMWDRRRDFTFDQEVAASADEAIDRALEAPERTVFISDSGDNPTAGAPGDATQFLSRLLARGVPDAVLAGIPDGDAVAECVRQGVGARVSIRVGGKMDSRHGEPVAVTGRVEHVYQPSEPADETDDVILATIRVEGVRLVVTSRRYVYRSPTDFHKAGIDPLRHKIVVVKLGYLMAPLRDIAPRELLALTPGYADLELTRLPYRYVTHPIVPLDDEFAWRPVVTNVAAFGEDDLTPI